MNKIDQFSQRARRVFWLAQAEAEASKHRFIEPEHLLIAMTVEEDCVASHVLSEAGVSVESLRVLLSEMNLEKLKRGGRIDLSDLTKRVLELSVDTARRMGHDYVGTEHVLTALMRQSKPGVVAMITQAGTTPPVMIERVKSFLLRPRE